MRGEDVVVQMMWWHRADPTLYQTRRVNGKQILRKIVKMSNLRGRFKSRNGANCIKENIFLFNNLELPKMHPRVKEIGESVAQVLRCMDFASSRQRLVVRQSDAALD